MASSLVQRGVFRSESVDRAGGEGVAGDPERVAGCGGRKADQALMDLLGGVLGQRGVLLLVSLKGLKILVPSNL
jgi:hypothetical protein